MTELANDMFSFGMWVRRRRKALDLTQAALADCVGCAEVTIRQLEADAFRPSREVASRLAVCLGIAADDQTLFLQSARGEWSVDSLAPAACGDRGYHLQARRENVTFGTKCYISCWGIRGRV